jgi:endonuclease YncB( thermonuclease family)
MSRFRSAALAVMLASACSPVEVDSIYWSDGDSGRINGVEFRLHGVDAPETGGVGAFGGAECEAERELGYEAKAAVVEYTRGKPIDITRSYGADRYGREVVDLSVDGEDLGSIMISRGAMKRWDYDSGEPKPDWCNSGGSR